MGKISFNESQQTLEGINISGHITIDLDDTPSIKLAFFKKLRISFKVKANLQIVGRDPVDPTKTNLKEGDPTIEYKDSDSFTLSYPFQEDLSTEFKAGSVRFHHGEKDLVLLQQEVPTFTEELQPEEGKFVSSQDSLQPMPHVEGDTANSQNDPTTSLKHAIGNNSLYDNSLIFEESQTPDFADPTITKTTDETLCEFDSELKCFFCCKIFSNKAKMAAHNRVPACVRKCEKCEEHFLCGADLFIHQYKKYDADFMAQQYPSFSILEKNLCKWGQCPLCKTHFQTPSSVLKHLQAEHFSDASYACCLCSHVFTRHMYLKDHLKDCQVSQKQLADAQEGIIGSADNNITNRGMTLNDLNENQQCNKSFTTKRDGLNSLNKIDIPKSLSNGNFSKEPLNQTPKLGEACDCSCSVCHKIFSNIAERAAHHRVSECVRNCKKCGKVFLCEADLFIHQYKEHSLVDLHEKYQSFKIMERSVCEKNQCPICQKKCNRMTNLKEHVQSVHFIDASYICCLCKFIHRSLSCFTKHLQKHTLNGKRKLSSNKETCNVRKKSRSGSISQERLPPSSSEYSNMFIVKPQICPVANADREEIEAPQEPAVSSHSSKCIPCKYCGKVFNSISDKNNHNKIPLKKIKCPKCPCILSSPACFIVHDFEIHEKKFDLEIFKGKTPECMKNRDFSDSSGHLSCCPLCEKQVVRLVDHIAMFHTEELRYQCCVCGEKKATYNAFRKHCEYHLRPGYKKYGLFHCSRCPTLCKSRSEFSRHLAAHRSECLFCKTDIGHPHLLEVHYESEHAQQLFTCKTCGKKLPAEHLLRAHEKNHRYPFLSTCPVCGKLLKSNLDKHISKKHPETHGKPEDVLEISKKESTNAIYKEASITEHDTNKYECDECHKTFPSQCNLLEHLKLHKPISCPTCKKTFATQKNLTKHIDTIHLKRHSHTCEICGKTTTSGHNLKTHMLTHASAKRFFCEVCGQGFNYKASLKGHLISKHKNSKDK
ncbi:Zinc finger protein 208 [Plakobranchus ocellatus]|uniref:Zinc finger protein 208 n=1 Tax=Plakobranchus ocellatus TaxID=259542 RepID=A0AAV4DWY0_9GAST|nr:Zinc finger protein 208 [Plakobranchus ocellatus]